MRSLAAHALDPLLERAARRISKLPLRDPIRWALADHRARAMRRALAAHLGETTRLSAAVVAGEPSALAAYDDEVARAIASMRADRPEGVSVAAALDRALYANRGEILDDPSFPEAERAQILALIDRLNSAIGSYDTFSAVTAPLVELGAAGGGPVRVHDLASGHGGFAIDLARRFGAGVEVVASDVDEAYLDLGRARASSLGLRVGFERQDALDLRPLVGAGVDVFTCTQTVHHFAPGQVARMMGEAARAARVGVVLVDAERSWLFLSILGPFTAVYGRSYPIVHDTVASLRRMYYEEELALLAALAPGLPEGSLVETGFAPPGHAYVRITRSEARARANS